MGLNSQVLNWLESRHLDVEIAVKLGIESCENQRGGENVIKFPFKINGEVVNNKYRRLPKNGFWQDKEAVKCFWNYDVITDPSLESVPLVITEGEIDAITAIQCGFIRTVSVPDGAPNKEMGRDTRTDKYAFLDHARAALKDIKEIIIAVDSDQAGKALANDLAIRLGKARCKWVKYPRGCKDLNETLEKYGPRGVTEVFNRAEDFKIEGLYCMKDLPPYADKKVYTTGKEWLDPHYKIRMGDFCVITGIPGHGKSTLVNDIYCESIKKHGWRVAIASFEQHPQADHQRALREWYCQKPVYLTPKEELEEADEWINEHFVFIVPDDEDLANLSWCLDKCAAAVVRYNCKIIVIDPWNELDHDCPPDMSLTEYTGTAIKQFKRMAKSMDCHMVVVAHPTKLMPNQEPTLYSISDSAHWANKADVGLVVYKPKMDSNFAEVRIVKSRYFEEIGEPGTVPTRYDRLTRRFLESDPPEDEEKSKKSNLRSDNFLNQV